jgi:hypothetical protein
MSIGRRIRQYFHGGDLSGSAPNPVVVKIQSKAVASTAPSDGQFLKWVNANSQWEPANLGSVASDFTQNIAFSGDISPAQITADQNDYDPTGLSTASVIRLDFDSTLRNITGLQGGADGRLIILINVSANYGLLKDESASSSAANRFALPGGDLPLGPDEAFILQYDVTSSRWRPFGLIAPAVSPAFETLTDGATITWDFKGSRARNATVTLGGNRTLALSNVPNGANGLLIVKQDGTGSRTLALPASSKVVGGGAGAITLTTTASGIDVISFYYDATNYLWTYGKNFT